MPILIDNTNLTDIEKSLLTQRGASSRLFRIKFSLADRLLTIPGGDKEPDISFRTQEQWLIDETKGVLSTPLQGQRLILITSDAGEMVGRALALTILRTALSVHMQRAEQAETSDSAPRWHTIYGGRFDKLRDQYERQLEDGRPCMLVLDNLQLDMQADKADRLRDLLRIYEDMPRIVVATGCDPISFVRRRFLPEPDMMFYLPSMVTVYDRSLEDGA